MSINFLSNNFTNININFDKLIILNNLKETLLKHLDNIKNKTEENLLKLNNNFNNIQDFESDYINIKYSNINTSLDIINNYDNINSNLLVYFYDKYINFNFKNYSISNIILEYKKIIKKITQIINFNEFSFNLIYLDNNLESIHLYDLLKNKLKNSANELTKNNIIDLYLTDIENVPESSNDLLNYIYFLRKFPLFRIILNNYLQMHENDLYKIIETLNLDNLNDQDSTFFSPYFSFDNEKKIHNVFLLFKENYILNNIYYKLPLIEEYNKDNILEKYRKINIKEYGMIENDFIYPNLFFNKINNSSSQLEDILCIYLKCYNVKYESLENISLENYTILISNFLINIFIIIEYLNLKQFKTHEEFLLIYNNIDKEINDLTFDHIFNNTLFYVYSAFFISQKDFLYNILKTYITYIKHFLYLFKYFNDNANNIFPLFVFFSCSNENIKFIYEYKNNNLLDFFIEFYDLIYPNAIKIVIKKKY